jgi:type VI protein secretion system component Hcp
MELAARGKTIPEAKLEWFRADGANPLKYYAVTLENVLVSSKILRWVWPSSRSAHAVLCQDH